MAESSQITQYIELYIDVSRSPAEQAASLDAIASLVKKDLLTIERLVKEMDMYLTTTDNLIRSRGILLLGEVLKALESKSLGVTSIHGLIGFFTERLADWRALRGALVGCLALMRRQNSVGIVVDTDAKAVAESYLQNLQVQALGQYDRKLCFELLECLLERYPDAVTSMGDNIVYGTCEAMDGEKDPQCLMLVFHIVEVIARLFPDPDGPLASNCRDVFEGLGQYFPLHFTHPKGVEADVKRDSLSKALMLAFSSTPFFEPFAIPLLLEKLSSSLPIAKVDSLKYLNDCASSYGADRMAKHSNVLWSTLKDTIYSSHETVLSFSPDSLEDLVDLEENEIAKEAVNLLKKLVMQNNSFLTLIIEDLDINSVFKTITTYQSYDEMPLQSRHKLSAVGQVFSASAIASNNSCNRIFESFFLRLMEILGLSVRSTSGDYLPNDECVFYNKLSHGAFYLCTKILAASRDLVLGFSESVLVSDYKNERWFSIMTSFSALLAQAFTFAVRNTNEDTFSVDIYLGVKGLQILCVFPGGYSLVSKSIFEGILATYISMIMVDCKKSFAWKLALKALVYIGSFIDKSQESEKLLSYMNNVVDKIISLHWLDHHDMPISLKLEVIFAIGSAGPSYMLKTVLQLEEALLSKFSEIYVHEDSQKNEIIVQLLDCFCNKVLPRVAEIGSEEALLHFAIGIWNQIENCAVIKARIHERGLIDAAMLMMKLIVGICSVESQNIVIEKAYTVLLSSTFEVNESSRIQVAPSHLDSMSNRDEWILSLFGSVIIAIRPESHIPNTKSVLNLFMLGLLMGHVPAAQALGSLVNKLASNSNGTNQSSGCSQEEAINIIFNTTSFSFDDDFSSDRSGGMSNSKEVGLIKLCCGVDNSVPVRNHAITGLAWIGKGLLMRGHERVKDITMIFLECLLSNENKGALPQNSPNKFRQQNEVPSVMKCAADAFQILMCDSDVCLNKKFHAAIRPLYKQRFFSIIMLIMQSLFERSNSSFSRLMMHRAFAHIVADTPLIAILDNAKKLIPLVVNCLSTLGNDSMNKDVMFSLLLVLSGMLTDRKGEEVVLENALSIIRCLIGLTAYPHLMHVRETAIQCLIAMARLPHARIYPLRTQVLQTMSKALDDPKRIVRQEAVRCRQVW